MSPVLRAPGCTYKAQRYRVRCILVGLVWKHTSLLGFGSVRWANVCLAIRHGFPKLGHVSQLVATQRAGTVGTRESDPTRFLWI